MTYPLAISSVALLAAGLAACGASPRHDPAELARLEMPARDRCAVARDTDFEGPGRAELQRYVDWLAANHGTIGQLRPGDVALAVADSDPKPGLRGVVAGEIGCSAGGAAEAPFRITLYQRALEGRQLQAAYHTVAHEFQHIVQIRRDGLACHGSDEAEVERYEREAMAVADRLVPACE